MTSKKGTKGLQIYYFEHIPGRVLKKEVVSSGVDKRYYGRGYSHDSLGLLHHEAPFLA